MSQSVIKIFLIIAAACVFFFFGTASAGIPAENTVQPQALEYSGIYKLRQTESNLTGAGVKFALVCRSITYIDGEPQNNYQPNVEHNCLNPEQFTFHHQDRLAASISQHSTAICSILFGEDSNAVSSESGRFDYEGIAPAAKAEIYEFWYFLINNVFPQRPPEVDVVTASIGSSFEDWWTRGIESLAEHNGLIVVAGIGNGSEAYDSVLYPAAGTNIIGVGVIDSATLAQLGLVAAEHSSIGPTTDGRCKPDIVAPGNCLAADSNTVDGYEATGSFSSFSTPAVAGTAGLLVQKAKEDPNLSNAVSGENRNSLIKAILLNSATKLPYWHKGTLSKDDDHNSPLDYAQGAGALNAVAAYENLTAGEHKPGDCPVGGWDINQLQKTPDKENIYTVILTEPNEKFITATVAWNKHYAASYPFEPQPEKDANLRLEVWAIDPFNPQNDYLLDYSDSSSDNLEHIHCRANANYTNYEIVISNSNTLETAEANEIQNYAIAWNVGIEDSSKGPGWYDLNGDGKFDPADVIVLANNMLAFNKSPDSYLYGDINDDGMIDTKDIQVFLKHISQSAE